jgi:cytochrome c oxidase subunit 3
MRKPLLSAKVVIYSMMSIGFHQRSLRARRHHGLEPLALPSVLYLNTLVLLASSAALEFSRRILAAACLIEPRGARKSSAWQQLRTQGVYLASNPNSSFFYVLTFIHVLHALAGILAPVYLAARLIVARSVVRRSFFDNTAIYWHFICVLWLYLFLLCRFKL